jgi:hypothetical protein
VVSKQHSFLVQDSSCENVIQRDINRTFPAHDFFKEAGGLGQDSLYRISKAYAVHDSEVGYCQGLSFLAATLLLHVSAMITDQYHHMQLVIQCYRKVFYSIRITN